jgi:hypothetical protein
MIFSGSKALKGRADEEFAGPGGKMVSARCAAMIARPSTVGDGVMATETGGRNFRDTLTFMQM